MNTWRTEVIKLIPWVIYLREKVIRCEGYRWSHMPLRDACDPERREKHRCSQRGYWRFKASKRSNAYDGVYCWQHLLSAGLYHDMIEVNRTNSWFSDNVIRVNNVRRRFNLDDWAPSPSEFDAVELH